MVKKSKSDAAKNILWPGATPFLALVSRQNPFGLRGSLPATVKRLRRLHFVPRLSQTPACQHSFATLARAFWQILPELTGSPCHKSSNRGNETKELPCRCLSPPAPTVAKRKYYIRLDERLAVTMERYAEFIGTHSADQVITEALEFVFKKDTDFREWLEKNPKRNPEPSVRKTNATRPTETARVSDTAERQEAL